MDNHLPDHLRESLSESDYSAVLRWWNSLTPEDRQEFSDVSVLPDEERVALPDTEDGDRDPEMQPFYDYLVNHELRCVGYVDDTGVASSYKIMSHYVASLGSEMRHRRGTVE